MKYKLNVTGMTCAACSARVEKVTSQVKGVKSAQVNFLAGTMVVEADGNEVVELVIRAVTEAGYGVQLPGEQKKNNEALKDGVRSVKIRIVVSAVFLIVLIYFTMGHMIGLPLPDWYHGIENALVAALLQLTLTLPVVYLNRVYYARGIKALFKGAPNMDSLIAVGSGASLLYGLIALFRMAYSMGHGQWETVKLYSENLYFESAAMILTLITLGKFLEARAKRRTGDAIRKLMDLSPKTATVRRNGAEKQIAIEDVRRNDTVIVRSGGSIPVDGTILSGRAAVDQSALTGESVPIEKVQGDTVAAATINTEGYLEIRADKVGQDTTLAKIIKMVEEAGGSKAPIARIADKIAGIFVPVVMTISLIAFAVWVLAGQTLEFSLTTAIAVLVISCPCALGLATPVAIMVGTGQGAGMGVLFKNAEALENLHNIDTVVLDKTGTLTEGRPVVTEIIPGNANADQLLKIAASLESQSEHPFAKAIMQRAVGLPLMEMENFETLPGRGVCAIINHIKYYGGNLRLMEEVGVTTPDFAELAMQGRTPLYFAAEDGTYLGAVIAADVLKSESVDAVKKMHKQGLRVIMLTGDNKKTADAIAEKAKIDEVISDVLPADKARVIEQLRSDGKKVLMVGDGINDAPALITADVGMAIGTGTDIAVESADVVLMNDSLEGVSKAVALSKATIRNIKQNLFWAFFYNALGIPIAAGVLYPHFGIQLNPMLGAAAMSLSSVFVVTNALRLRFFKPNAKKEKKEPEEHKEEIKMETVIKVEGMMCPHCKARVESVCKGVSGVVDAVVDLTEKQVSVTGDASVEMLKKAIAEAGYEVIG